MIKLIEEGEKKSDIGKKLGVGESTVRSIWNSRDKLKAAYSSFDNNRNFKKMRASNHESLDQALLKWFKQQRSLNAPINGHVLQSKAGQLAELLGMADFNCSSAWIDRFKVRHNINFGKVCGEAKDVDNLVTEKWIQSEWPKIRNQFKDEDIFNGDETGLFFKMAPQNTLKFKHEKCVGGKMSKDRVTVFVCANMSGTEKRELLVVGKSRNPRCFKNLKKLPVKYRASKRAWMTADLFEAEICNWDTELAKKGRRIALLLDNCTAHPQLAALTNIQLTFLPPNTTSVLQPMDQGVIRSLKCHYR